MTRLALLVIVVVGFGCSKPSEEDCRKAISNMQRLMGTDNMRDDGRLESEVRRCKGGSKKSAVDCAIKAQTLDDLRRCEFFKVPENAKGIGADVGSAGSGSAAAPPAGSAAVPPADGSAAGSAAAGSGAPTGAGSASGSAATGSATTPGAAAGSAATAPAGVGSAK